MKSFVIALAALVAVSCLAQPASANGGFVRQRQRVVVQRQVIVQKQVVVAQPVYQQQIVQRVYAQPVQAVYAQPVVQAYVQPVCAQPIVQGFRQRQIGGGCQSFFAH